MAIFVDASALVSIIAGEPDADDLADRLEAHEDRVCSAMSLWESMTALVRTHGVAVDEARERVFAYVEEGTFRIVGIAGRELGIALDAWQRFGKGRHPAALNMGDCFAYACAKANDAVLLYKGNNFARTDLA